MSRWYLDSDQIAWEGRIRWIRPSDPFFKVYPVFSLDDLSWISVAARLAPPVDDIDGREFNLLERLFLLTIDEFRVVGWPPSPELRSLLASAIEVREKRKELQISNDFAQYRAPELDLLFERDPDLPPSWHHDPGESVYMSRGLRLVL